MKKILYIALVGIIACACNVSECLDNSSSIPLAGFYSSLSGKAVTVSQLQIRGLGAPYDSILLSGTASKSQVYLPMRSDYPSTSWILSYGEDAAVSDTVTFYYRSEPYFASEECGAMYRYTITDLKYSTHGLDSVVIKDSVITNTDTERIRIYFPGETSTTTPQQ